MSAWWKVCLHYCHFNVVPTEKMLPLFFPPYKIGHFSLGGVCLLFLGLNCLAIFYLLKFLIPNRIIIHDNPNVYARKELIWGNHHLLFLGLDHRYQWLALE